MNKTNSTVTVLIILDGFGYSLDKEYNAIYHAVTPHYDAWMQEYPHAILQAAGPAVGLPPGAIGNSEAGHLTIGAGRITQEPVTRINNAIDDGSFATNPKLINALERMDKNKTLHFIGLLSDAGVHAHMKQLDTLLDIAHRMGFKHIVVHPFLDGRDVPPQSAGRYLHKLVATLKKIGGKIGSIHGRYYAMDRDKNWDRTEKSYRALTEPQKNAECKDWECLINNCYEQHIIDEFIPPTQLDPDLYIKDGDGIIFFNFRPDRARQLTASFVDPTFNAFKTKPLKLACFITPTVYSDKLKTDALYKQEPINNTLKEVLVSHGKTIFSIAETEKYAHVTYFFGGGKEATLLNETRILIPSKKYKNYAEIPEMSAAEITKTVLKSLQKSPCDFYLINYANADMVGHTGNFGATIQAIEFIDAQLAKLYDQIITKMNGTMYVTADHGNAEVMYDKKEKQPSTSHTTNPVPFIMIRNDLKGHGNQKLPLTQLSDIAPFILKNMGLPIPKEMQKY
jgi:2,3-bisphosphoglycerate-independent phosphoglycerate mutase